MYENDERHAHMLFAVPGFIWLLIAVILVIVILGMVFGRGRRA